MRTETTHGLRFAAHPRQPGFVQSVGLDHRDGDIAIEPGVMRAVDALLRALAQETLHLVAPRGKRRRQRQLRLARRRADSRRCRGGAGECRAAGTAKTLLRRIRVLARRTCPRQRSTAAAAETVGSGILLTTGRAVHSRAGSPGTLLTKSTRESTESKTHLKIEDSLVIFVDNVPLGKFAIERYL